MVHIWPRGGGAATIIFLLLLLGSSPAAADNILETVGVADCGGADSTIRVQRAAIKYQPSAKEITFDVRGTSETRQPVIAYLSVTAYGRDIYQNRFDPCDGATFVEQLCPVPEGTFAANGTLPIPAQYADMVPAIAFQVPDIAAMANLRLVSTESNATVACVESQVTNGRTASVPAVAYVAAGLAAVALLMSGVSAAGAALAGAGAGAGAGGGGGAAASSSSSATAAAAAPPHPTFGDFFGTLQATATTGMLSVAYPPVVRSFSANFAFSVGLIPWARLQEAIDRFRAATGGNVSADSYDLLRNTTLVFPDNSTQQPGAATQRRRSLETLVVDLARRAIETSVNGTAPTTGPGTDSANGGDLVSSVKKTVSGISAFSEQLMVPESNTFLTMLLVVAILIGTIIVSILLVKVVLELWALGSDYPKRFRLLRDDYWGIIGRTVTHLILLLYGIWVMFAVHQFAAGDSWAAKALAAVTLVAFTLVLAFFTWKIITTAARLRAERGDAGALFDEKTLWTRYSLFYESYRRSRWWVFVPNIIYLLLRGAVVAGLAGLGLVQAIALLAVEVLMLVTTLATRPFARRSGNVVNLMILVVRVISVTLLLVFVDELGMTQTTQTVAGVVLIAAQSTLTGILGILIIWNAFIALCKENPHRRRRKQMRRLRDSTDALTPLDARNSLLQRGGGANRQPVPSWRGGAAADEKAAGPDAASYGGSGGSEYFSYTAGPAATPGQTVRASSLLPAAAAAPARSANGSTENLVLNAAAIDREPTLPLLDEKGPGPYRR